MDIFKFYCSRPKFIKVLRLFVVPNFPGPTFISESRVVVRSVKSFRSCWKKQVSITMCIDQKCVCNLIRSHIRPTKTMCCSYLSKIFTVCFDHLKSDWGIKTWPIDNIPSPPNSLGV